MTDLIDQLICQECVNIIDSRELLTCDQCKDTYHFNCAKLNATEYSVLRQNIQLLWKCNLCLDNIHSLNTSFSMYFPPITKTTFECDLCSKEFSKKSNLRTHMNIHLDVRPFHCKTCGTAFRLQHHLVRHTAKHTTPRPALIQKPIIITRMEKPRSLTEKKPQTPVVTYPSRRQKVQKPLPEATAAPKLYPCPVCSKRFNEREIRAHTMIHQRMMKLHKCQFCLRLFSSRLNLTIHIKRMHQEKKHKCDECDKAYFNKQQLDLHLMKHKEEVFTCEVCGKSFHRPDYLRSHMKLHTDEKKFTCEHCSKAFHNVSTLRHHYKVGCRILGLKLSRKWLESGTISWLL